MTRWCGCWYGCSKGVDVGMCVSVEEGVIVVLYLVLVWAWMQVCVYICLWAWSGVCVGVVNSVGVVWVWM